MSLTQALNTALAGLQVTQAGLSVVAGNIANVQTPDYVRKTLEQIETAAGGVISVRTAGINRQLNELVQMQLRTETSGGSYADTLDKMYQQLQGIYGAPGSSTGLDTLFNNFTTALQNLIAAPNSVSSQNNVINTAQMVVQQLNSMSSNIQTLRTAAEQGISGDVQTANEALQHIASLNVQLASSTAQDASKAGLMDQRDAYINQLTQLMSVRVTQGDNNQVSVYTSNGIQLVGVTAVQLSFDAHGTVNANALWNANPNLRGVGTVTLTAPGGASMDLIAAGALSSGEIGGYLQMRDQILPQAQTQLDDFAAQMAQAASNVTTAGTATTVGAQSGFVVDTAGLQNGNSIQFTYTDAANVSHDISVVRVDDPTALPLANTATADPNDQVIGVDFSGGMASIVAQLNTALGATGLQFANPAGTSLRILNDVANTISVDSASTTQTVTSLTSGNPQLPLFTDGSNVYSGAISASGSQLIGFASRIGVNSAVVTNPASLVVFQSAPPTATGDPTRPTYLFDQMANTGHMFSPATGIGGIASPYSGSLSGFIGQIITTQGQSAANASSLRSGQDVVVNALQQRLDDDSAVNIDKEMTNLLNLQNAYGANARVMSAIKDMIAVLMNM